MTETGECESVQSRIKRAKTEAKALKKLEKQHVKDSMTELVSEKVDPTRPRPPMQSIQSIHAIRTCTTMTMTRSDQDHDHDHAPTIQSIHTIRTSAPQIHTATIMYKGWRRKEIEARGLAR